MLPNDASQLPPSVAFGSCWWTAGGSKVGQVELLDVENRHTPLGREWGVMSMPKWRSPWGWEARHCAGSGGQTALGRLMFLLPA